MDEYIGMIRIFGGDWAPPGWLVCNGQTLAIAQYRKLFSVVGTTYGGDGSTTFRLPNLQSVVPVGGGQGQVPDTRQMSIGEVYGEESHALSLAELPMHNHSALVSNTSANLSVATKDSLMAAPGYVTDKFYATAAFNTTAPDTVLHEKTIENTGEGVAHENRQPFVAMNFIICVEGTIPPKPGDVK